MGRRLWAIERMKVPEKSKETAAEALSLAENHSSDESDVENGKKTFYVKKLSWESDALTSVKHNADKVYRMKSGVYLYIKRRQHKDPSKRPLPDSPIKWAVQNTTAKEHSQRSSKKSLDFE